MTAPNAIDEILNFAIRNEEEAVEFYRDLAARFESSPIRSIFNDFAREEEGHKDKLTRIKTEKLFVPDPEKVKDLKIADYLDHIEIGQDIDYPQALKVAMNREKKSFRLYTKLADAASDGNVRDLFAFLAQEEAKHKLRFEVEYDEYVLREN